MSAAAVVTTAFVAMLFFRGTVEAARALWSVPRSMPHRLSRSRLSRRRQRLTDLFVRLFDRFGGTWKPLKAESIAVIDSLPIAACAHARMPRVTLYRATEYRGCLARKKRSSYGRKVHLLGTTDGQPVECFLTPGSSTVIQQKNVGFSGPAISQRNQGGKGGPEHVDDDAHHRRT